MRSLTDPLGRAIPLAAVAGDSDLPGHFAGKLFWRPLKTAKKRICQKGCLTVQGACLLSQAQITWNRLNHSLKFIHLRRAEATQQGQSVPKHPNQILYYLVKFIIIHLMWYQTLIRSGENVRMWRGSNLAFDADAKGPMSSIYSGPLRTQFLSIFRSETRLSGYMFIVAFALLFSLKSAVKPAINKQIKDSEQKHLKQKFNEIGFRNKAGVSTRPFRSSNQFISFLSVESELESTLSYSSSECSKAMLEASYKGLDGPLGEEDRIMMAYETRHKELYGKKAKTEH